MTQTKITRKNFLQALESTLSSCRSRLEEARAGSGTGALMHDLEMGIQALEGIRLEMRGTIPQRTRRSALFMRYVIDEEQHMAMEPALRDAIVEIESVYARM